MGYMRLRGTVGRDTAGASNQMGGFLVEFLTGLTGLEKERKEGISSRRWSMSKFSQEGKCGGLWGQNIPGSDRRRAGRGGRS